MPLPIKKIGELCEKNGLLFLCDGAQGGGHIPIDIKESRINLLALAGHKGLYGVMGSGALVIDENTEVSPLLFGGTGSESFNLDQPKSYPERLESGTLNLPAIAALNEGANYVRNNLNTFSEVLLNYTEYVIEELSKIKGVRCYSESNPSGIVSFSVDNISSSMVADTLDADYDIAVRSGFHCAPLTHKFLGTEKDGLVRASFSVQNSVREINCFLSAMKKISRG